MEQPKEALGYIDRAINHTPTFIEAYLIKGQILKQMGDYKKAYEVVDFGRSLDEADRYLNNVAIEYSLLNNDYKRSDELVKMFIRDPTEDGSMYDMQAMWFELC